MKNEVLIIDDDQILRKYFKCQIERYGVSVTSTGDPGEGLGLIESLRPTITFVDFVMPEMNGDELLIKISEKKLFHCSSFYLYTAKRLSYEENFKLMTLGFTHILNKPIESDELERILKHHELIKSEKSSA